MSEIIIVYWRDIPAQIIKGKGRRAEKIQLSDRFEKAIDRCAMKIGSKSADSYLKDWHKKALGMDEAKFDTIQEQADHFERKYHLSKLKEIVKNDGWEVNSNKNKKEL